MAQFMKRCIQCGERKEFSQFSKRSLSKDGLQSACKSCNKINNKKFRVEINPEYQTGWYSKNRDKWNAYQYEVQNNDYWSIYIIVAPDEMVYTGQCHCTMEKRLSIHQSHYRHKNNRKYRIPLLWDSFDKHGVDTHIMICIDRADSLEEALKKENYYIDIFQQQNKSLNKNKNKV